MYNNNYPLQTSITVCRLASCLLINEGLFVTFCDNPDKVVSNVAELCACSQTV